MGKLILLLILVTMVLIVGCEGVDVSKISDNDLNRISAAAVVCNEPYIRYGSNCCLDKNSNNICDKDEIAESGEASAQEPAVVKEKKTVILTEFADFEDPFSSRFYSEILPLIKENYINKGLVEFKFRHFPLTFHPNAQKAAEAAECAREQGKFEKMHNTMFERGISEGEEKLKEYSIIIGLADGKFNDCLDSEIMTSKVKKDLQEGQLLGVSGTPTFFVNDKMISGAQPYKVFEELIETELGR